MSRTDPTTLPVSCSSRVGALRAQGSHPGLGETVEQHGARLGGVHDGLLPVVVDRGLDRATKRVPSWTPSAPRTNAAAIVAPVDDTAGGDHRDVDLGRG